MARAVRDVFHLASESQRARAKALSGAAEKELAKRSAQPVRCGMIGARRHLVLGFGVDIQVRVRPFPSEFWHRIRRLVSATLGRWSVPDTA